MKKRRHAKKPSEAGDKSSAEKSGSPERNSKSVEPAVEEISIPVLPIKPGFPIVGLAASAGGLEALREFFAAVPRDSGVAYVVVVHLDPTHVSILPELLQQSANIPVVQIENGMSVLQDHVYVVPPNSILSVNSGILMLSDRPEQRGQNLPIDYFFRSLAEDQEANAVGIILSGTGTDGTSGARDIKCASGMVMVQDDESAKYNGMPRSAVAAGVADYVLPPKDMPDQLMKYVRHAGRTAVSGELPADELHRKSLQKVFALIRSRTTHDFSLYKQNTILRRIARRMNLNQIDDIDDYVRYLQDSTEEVDVLFRELLIGVTSFFRDPDVFRYLKDSVFPKMFQDRPEDSVIRVWVAGCSTGEEAYSLAISLHEYMDKSGTRLPVQIFGTDIDDTAIATARAAIYPASIQADMIDEGQIRRYFDEDECGQYRLKKHIREMLVFAPHNILKDPPFTKLDLLSCRNVLIYLSSDLQRKLLPIFNYSLKPNGVLLLGTSETTGHCADLFETLNKKGKVYRRSAGSQSYRVAGFPVNPPRRDKGDRLLPVQATDEISALDLVESILKNTLVQPCAVIDDACNVIYIHGRLGRFLQPPEGRVSQNILGMARAGLKTALKDMMQQASALKKAVNKRGLRVRHEGGTSLVDITVKPLLEPSGVRGMKIVSFDAPSSETKQVASKQNESTTGKGVEDLEEELGYVKETLQATIEELETSNEELKSTNEELQSTNEELQSTNEELETSKEELQSLNEEAATVNAELQSRIDQLSHTNDDMKNLLDSTNVATLFLDMEMNIRRFTPAVKKIVPITASDFGRPVSDIASRLNDVDLVKYGAKVLEDLSLSEAEVESIDGEIYLMRVRPYRTLMNVIDGVVITFEDITISKQAMEKSSKSELLFRSLFELSRDSVVLIDPASFRLLEFNTNAHDTLGYSKDEFGELTLSDIEQDASQDSINRYMDIMKGQGSGCFETKHITKAGTEKFVSIDGRAVKIGDKEYLLSIWRERQGYSEISKA